MDGITFLPMLLALHTSDFTEGPQSEVTQDFIGAGVIAQWRDIEIEGALGWKYTNCKLYDACESTPAGYASVRWIIGGRP